MPLMKRTCQLHEIYLPLLAFALMGNLSFVNYFKQIANTQSKVCRRAVFMNTHPFFIVILVLFKYLKNGRSN